MTDHQNIISATANANTHAGLDSIFANIDRLPAFRAARRHSYLVKFLKLALPLSAAGIAVITFAPILLAPQIKGLTIKGGITAENPTSYKMRNPHYEGFDKKNGNYTIDAKSATIDIKNSGAIPLEKINVNVVHLDKTRTAMTSSKGLYNREKKTMRLFDGVEFHNSTGMSAYFKSADIDITTKNIVSNEPVKVKMSQGQITANAINIHGQKKYVEFKQNVKLLLIPPAPKKKAVTEASYKPEPPEKPKNKGLMGGMTMDNSLPINSAADLLTISDSDKTAILTGNVKVNQGVYDLLTNKLQINYATPPKKKDGTKKAESSNMMSAASGKIKSIHAQNGMVIYTADGRSIQGESAEFNMAENSVFVTGSQKNKMIISSKEAELTAGSMKMNTALNTIHFDKAVLAKMGKNHISSDQLKINTKTNIVNFDGKVALIAYNQQKAGKKLKKPKKKRTVKKKGKGLLSGGASKMDPTKPIRISASHLMINDKKKVAVFNNKVIAKQDNFSLRAEKLTAYYTGQMQPMKTSVAAAPKETVKKKKKKSNQGQLKKIIAKTKVLITSGQDQTVSGDKAVFNVVKNIAVIEGNVILSQKGNILKGDKLILDLNTSQYKLFSSKKSRVKLLVTPTNNKAFKFPR